MQSRHDCNFYVVIYVCNCLLTQYIYGIKENGIVTYLAVLKMKINFCIHFECLFKSESSPASGQVKKTYFRVCPDVKIWTNTAKYKRSLLGVLKVDIVYFFQKLMV